MRTQSIASIRMFLFLLPAILCAAPAYAGADWTQFRGNQRNGITQETGLLAAWPEGGPRLIWETTGIGGGYSSPTIAEGSIFITGDLLNPETLAFVTL